MLNNLRKKYSGIMALSLVGVMNATPSLAYPVGVTSTPATIIPSTSESIQPQTSTLESLLKGPQVSRRISECYDNGLC
ncbi:MULTISPECIES: hypothetical protein [Planktothrix]|uniref:Uncharacterized protein n=1 Tax=Planktothrix mougeotii LEGE 06226 TaxID=1828728 RepID=A0ABR9U8V6_9CYAN|nr:MULTISPECIES: hypothetical protein [Planktothrix]MBD2481900.1 hypothetical protein [Planktothrix sp. FACHB-1365]MBE9142276.1 hypothetical protein [Planktothrix mougeotii LEGE 06226]